jgi:transcriptional regulator with XRE-family HTH domain
MKTNLQALRMERGMSQAELARALSVHPTFLSRLECGWYARVTPELEARLNQVFPEWSWEALMRKPAPPCPNGH